MNFDIVKNYGATVFVVYSFLQQNEGALALEIMSKTGLSRKTIDNCLKTLVDVKLLNRVSEPINKYGICYRYSTVQLQ
jgi:predicted transcriptional regulator